jgi:hypothetical protein
VRLPRRHRQTLAGAGLHVDAGGVGGHLVQQLVLRSAAHDVQRIERSAEQRLQLRKRPAVFQGQ